MPSQVIRIHEVLPKTLLPKVQTPQVAFFFFPSAYVISRKEVWVCPWQWKKRDWCFKRGIFVHRFDTTAFSADGRSHRSGFWEKLLKASTMPSKASPLRLWWQTCFDPIRVGNTSAMTYLRRQKSRSSPSSSSERRGGARAIPVLQAAAKAMQHAISGQLAVNFACWGPFSQPCYRQKGRGGNSGFSFLAPHTKRGCGMAPAEPMRCQRGACVRQQGT